MGNDDVDLEPDELVRELGKALSMSFGPSILDGEIAALGPAQLTQSVHKCGGPLALSRRRTGAQQPNGHQLSPPLGVRRKRPRGRRAAEKRDELAAPHPSSRDQLSRDRIAR